MLVMKPSYTPFVLYVELSGAFWAQLVDRSSSSRPHLRPKVMARINAGPGEVLAFFAGKSSRKWLRWLQRVWGLALSMIGLTSFIKVLKYIFFLDWLGHVLHQPKKGYTVVNGIPYFINNKKLCSGWFMALALPHEQINNKKLCWGWFMALALPHEQINNKKLCWGWFMALALPHEQIWTAHSLQGRQVAVAQGDLCTCWQIVSLGNFARHKCQDLWQINRIILISYDNCLIIMVDAVVSKNMNE